MLNLYQGKTIYEGAGLENANKGFRLSAGQLR